MHSGVTQTRRSFSFLHLIRRRAAYYVGLLVRSRQSRQNARRGHIAVHSPCFKQIDLELCSNSPRGKEETSRYIRSFDDSLNNDVSVEMCGAICAKLNVIARNAGSLSSYNLAVEIVVNSLVYCDYRVNCFLI